MTYDSTKYSNFITMVFAFRITTEFTYLYNMTNENDFKRKKQREKKDDI